MLRNRRRWVVATFVMIITAIAYVDRVNLSIAAPVLTKEFHTNAAVMGLLLSSFTWTYTLLNLPAGTDIRRVREQLSRMERRMNALTDELAALHDSRDGVR